MKSLANEQDRTVILDRLASVTAMSQAAWGGFTAQKMLCHVADCLRMAHGDLATKPPAGRAFTVFPLKPILLYLLPVPKNLSTAPELLSTEPTTFEQDREACVKLIRRFSQLPSSGKGPSHPFFGLLSWKEWGVLQWKHTDHHLRQFNT